MKNRHSPSLILSIAPRLRELIVLLVLTFGSAGLGLSTPESITPVEAHEHRAAAITGAGARFDATPNLSVGVLSLVSTSRANGATLAAGLQVHPGSGAKSRAVANSDRQGASNDDAFTVRPRGDGSLSAWEATSSLVTPRVDFGAVSWDGYVYALWGFSNSGPVLTVERAAVGPDGSLGPWQEVDSRATPRYGFAAVASDGYIYTIGGGEFENNGNLQVVEMAAIKPDGTLGPWQQTTALNTPRLQPAAAVSHGYIYALGGEYQTVGQASVERAKINSDGSLGPWQDEPPMNKARTDFSAVASGDHLYVVGGRWGGAIERAPINPDGSLGIWQNENWIDTERDPNRAVGAHGFIYAIGGSGSRQQSGRVDRAEISSDGSLDSWQEVASLNAGRTSHAVVVSDTYLYAIGGVGYWGDLDSCEYAVIVETKRVYLPVVLRNAP